MKILVKIIGGITYWKIDYRELHVLQGDFPLFIFASKCPVLWYFQKKENLGREIAQSDFFIFLV